MQNKSMERKLNRSEAIDLSKCDRTPEGDYILHSFTDDIDYCDAEKEYWIWSIGRRLSDGVILASTSAKFYQNQDFECIWLR